MRLIHLWFGAVFLLACGEAPTLTPENGAGAAGRERDEDHCISDVECSDGLFCNGAELCLPDEEDADDFGCVASRRKPECDDGIECTMDFCSDALGQCVFEAEDKDEDGHRDADCKNHQGDVLGDDCDDDDPDRFPGNIEVCDYEQHDEDCDYTTYGQWDRDGDGEFDANCCNVNEKDKEICGTDCNDASIAQRSKQPEFCDDIDNDCNGKVDDDPGPVPWYVDEDRDLFGAINAEPILSCEPVPGASILATDCRDDQVGLHPAQAELCDHIDNNCDGVIDEPAYCQDGGIVIPDDVRSQGSGGGSSSSGSGGDEGAGGSGRDEGNSGSGGTGGPGSGGQSSGGAGGTGSGGKGSVGDEPVVLWFDDFENGFGDWSVEGGQWAIGEPTYSAGPSAFSGARVAGTVLAGVYDYNQSARLVSPAFVVPAAESDPRLKFAYWYKIYNAGTDGGQLQISVNGGEWMDFPGQGVLRGNADAWAPANVPLTAYAGHSVRIGFLLTSDAATGSYGPGWYIDDVSLETGPMTWKSLEDFESGFGDWGVEGGQWAIGEPTYASGPSAFSGARVAGTVLAGVYDYNQSARLVSPAFVVPAVESSPRLKFAYWYNIYNAGTDGGQLQISLNGGEWLDFPGQGVLKGNAGAWAPANVSLTAYAGQSVRIGFLLTTDGATGSYGPGWYIDDVELVTD